MANPAAAADAQPSEGSPETDNAASPVRPQQRQEASHQDQPQHAPAPPAPNTSQCNKSTTFQLKQLVRVAARTWSGINQPGGVARVVAVRWVPRDDGGDTHDADSGCDGRTAATTPAGREALEVVTVQYVLDNRREKDVDVRYVTPYEGQSRLRNRDMIVGRCSRCGSLRRDCGFCDQDFDVGTKNNAGGNPRRVQQQETQRTHLREPRKNKKEIKNKLSLMDFLLSSSSSSSSSAEEDGSLSGDSLADIEMVTERRRRMDRKYRRFRLKSRPPTATGTGRKRRPLRENESSLMHLQSDSDSPPAGTDPVVIKNAMEEENKQKQKRDSFLDLNTSSSSGSDSHDDDWEDSLPLKQLILTQQEQQRPRSAQKSPYSGTGSMSLARKYNRFRLPSCDRRQRQRQSPGNNSPFNPPERPPPVSSPGTVDDSSSEGHSSTSGAPLWNDDDDVASDDGERDVFVEESQLLDLLDSDDDDFVQPEGDARRLPSDVRDDTKNLAYADLGPFFDERLEFIQTVRIPSAKAKLVAQEHKWKDSNNRASRIEWLREW